MSRRFDGCLTASLSETQKSDLRNGYLTTLQEVAERRDDGLANYRALCAEPPKNSGFLFDGVDLGIKRLSTRN